MIPERWHQYPVDLNFWLMRLTFQFLAGTQRINHVVYTGEEHIDMQADQGAGALIITRLPYPNVKPRIPMRDAGFLYGGIETRVGRKAVTTGIGLDDMYQRSFESEFFRWVDHLLPQEKGT